MNLWTIITSPFWIALFALDAVFRILGWIGTGAAKLISGHKKAGAYGDASFASKAELKPYFVQRGFMPGTFDGRRVYLDDETSAVVFGSRGAGKTQTFIANLKALKTRPVKPDLIVADPVGDIERAVSTDLQTMGYGLLRLDLTDPLNSHKYDPLSYLKPNLQFDYPRDVMTLCSLLLPEGGRMNDAGAHFLESARAMLQSMIMARDTDLGSTIVRLVVEKKERTADFAKMRAGGHPLIRQGVSAFEDAGDRERGSMDSTLSRKLRPWLDDAVREVTTLGPGDRKWTFEDIFTTDQPVAVFVRSGLGNEEFGGPLVRLVVGNAINTARRLWNHTGLPLPKGLWLFVDEARAMGHCQAVVDAVNELRKASVNVFLCFHTLQDVKDTYTSPQSLLNGCAWVISGGSRDLALYREASQLAGDRTVTTTSKSKGAYESESESETGKALVSAADLQKLSRGECVLIAPGLLARLAKPFTITRSGVRYP